MRFSVWMSALACGLSLASPAQAIMRCKILYSPAFTQQPPVASNVKPLVPVPGTRGGFRARFASDGVIQSATADFQLQPVPGQPGLGALTLRIEVANGQTGPAADSVYEIRDPAYRIDRGEPIELVVTRPDAAEVFFSNPPGQPAPKRALQFVGPGDFSSAALPLLSNQTIHRIELACQNELR